MYDLLVDGGNVLCEIEVHKASVCVGGGALFDGGAHGKVCVGVQAGTGGGVHKPAQGKEGGGNWLVQGSFELCFPDLLRTRHYIMHTSSHPQSAPHHTPALIPHSALHTSGAW